MDKSINFQTKLCLAAILCSILGSMFIPSFILQQQYNKQLDQVYTAPANQYLASKTFMAQVSSSQLSSLEQMQMIHGTINSVSSEVTSHKYTKLERDIVDSTVNHIEYLYQHGLYPTSIASGYQNWYSYSSKVYEYKDTTFDVYTTYLWELTFVKFDNSLTHKILTTENGIILAAEVQGSSYYFVSNPKNFYSTPILQQIFHTTKAIFGEASTLETYDLKTELDTYYPGFLKRPLYDETYAKVPFRTMQDQEYTYILYQYQTVNGYGIGILPLDTPTDSIPE